MTRYIGDVHAKWDQYKRIIEEVPYGVPSVQVGDFGVGFVEPDNSYTMPPLPLPTAQTSQHRFIRGNHDNLAVCQELGFFIDDGTIEDGVMYVGGALSIDRHVRKEGLNWWANEELSIEELSAIVDLYLLREPHTVVTHDCPDAIIMQIADEHPYFSLQKRFKSRTGQALQTMWDFHKPDLWIFGHYHVSIDRVIGGTRFRCLDELEYMDI